jgi:prevent-host-death family protein
MSKVNVTELRARLPHFVARVSAGETVEVASRGKVVARLVPVVERREEAGGSLRCSGTVAGWVT